jgi:cation-transporting ATPase E
VALKIISGDNPETVAALAKQAGWQGEIQAVSGLDLAKMDEAAFKQAAITATIFGRITPEQKEKLVQALRDQGAYVAMIGDGVNDVLSLKKADLGIAMESGSAAARGVANLVLLGDSFAALPHAFTEGQRIVNGMKDILRLYLTRVVYTALLIIAAAILGSGFPLAPKQNAVLSLFTVGLPTVALALWARPGALPRRSLLREVARFVLPASLTIFVFGLGIYLAAYYAIEVGLINMAITPDALVRLQALGGINVAATPAQFLRESARLVGQTALTTFVVYAGLLLVVFVEPPTQWWVAGEAFSGDWRPTLLAAISGVAYLGFVFSPGLSAAFDLIQLPAWGYILIALVVLIWMFTVRLMWQHRWLERWLGVDL